MNYLRALILGSVLAIIGTLLTTTPAQSSTWTPSPGQRWEWQLSSVPTTKQMDADRDVAAYDIDGFDASATKVSQLHARGFGAVCYISAGSWENWRPDAGKFPKSVLGSKLDGWAGERWLDIRRLDVLGPIMKSRMQMCAKKGFDAVEPDNVDGYSNKTGFRLTYANQIAYNKFLAKTAHSLGLKVALKNDVEQVKDLQPYFDWAVNEECFSYNECGAYSAFIKAGKAVWQVQYEGSLSSFCSKATKMGFSAMKKRYELDSWRASCPTPSNVMRQRVRTGHR